MRSNLTALPLALVSILGLASCSPDNNNVDQWKITEPIFLNKGSGVQIPITESSKELSTQLTLSFKKDEVENVEFEITAACGNPGSQFEEVIRLKNISEIPVTSLWPRDLWQLFSNDVVSQISCSHKVVVRNRFGSTHSFKLNPHNLIDLQHRTLKLQKKVELANQKLNPTGSLVFSKQEVKMSEESEEPFPNNGIHSELLALENETTLERTYFLKCENFRNARHFRKNASSESALDQLFSQDILGIDGAPRGLIGDPRMEKSIQTCEVVLRQFDDSTGLATYVPSTQLTVEFAHIKPRIETQAALTSYYQEKRGEYPLYRFTLFNDSPKPMYFRIPKRVGSVEINAVMRVFTYDSSPSKLRGVARSVRFSDPVDSVVIASKVSERMGATHFEIAPESQATVEIRMTSTKHCGFGAGGGLLTKEAEESFIAKGLWSLMGFELQFSNPIVIEQLRDYPNSENSRDQDWMPIELMPKDERWEAHEIYERFNPSGSFPTIDVEIKNPWAEGSFCHEGSLLEQGPRY